MVQGPGRVSLGCARPSVGYSLSVGHVGLVVFPTPLCGEGGFGLGLFFFLFALVPGPKYDLDAANSLLPSKFSKGTRGRLQRRSLVRLQRNPECSVRFVLLFIAVIDVPSYRCDAD